MATTGVFNGTNLLLKIGGTTVGHTTSCSMSLSMDTPEATTKDSAGFSEYIGGVKGGEISFEGLIAYDDSFNAIQAADNLTCVFGTAETGDAIYTADGFLTSVEMSGEMEAAVTYSGSITITGAIVKSTN